MKESPPLPLSVLVSTVNELLICASILFVFVRAFWCVVDDAAKLSFERVVVCVFAKKQRCFGAELRHAIAKIEMVIVRAVDYVAPPSRRENNGVLNDAPFEGIVRENRITSSVIIARQSLSDR